MTDAIPPGWSHNPSRWSKRLPILLLALTGCGIATYLALYQVNVLTNVWEPFFGNGSTRILKESSIAHLLPIPDAALGAVAYLLDALCDSIGGEDRWRSRPWIVLCLGAIAGALGVTGILLAIFQPLLFHAYCTLCLASAVCSVLTVFLVIDEVWAAWQHVQRQHNQGQSWWQALRGTSSSTTFSLP